MVNSMTQDPMIFFAILAMGLATYFTRITGYWMIKHVTISPRLQLALEAVPGSILIAIIAPAALSGPAEAGAALVTILIARRLPFLLAMVIGIASVVLFRFLLGETGLENHWHIFVS